MGTKTLAVLRDRLSEAIGDYLHETVTTALTTNNYVVDTDLVEYTSAENWFIRRWCLITSGANISKNRKISLYSVDNTRLTVMGAALVAEATPGTLKATFEIHTYNPDNKERAINSAARELWGYLFRRVEWDDTLVLGNHLPDGHFEDWSSSSALTWWTEESSITSLAQTSTAGLTRGGKYSVKATVSADNGYFATNSDIYPRLLNLQGQTINYYVWVYPLVADDAYAEIYTLESDGTATTTPSTTTCAASKWTRIGIENHSVPDDLSQIEFRCKVATKDSYVHFDKARVVGPTVYELLAPPDFHLGTITRFYEQITGDADDLYTSVAQCTPLFGVEEHTQEGYKYLRLPYGSSAQRKLILVGYAPLEDTLDAETETITIDDPHTDLLIARAAYRLYEMEMGMHAGEDVTRLRDLAGYWFSKSEELKRTLRMIKPQSHQRLRMI